MREKQIEKKLRAEVEKLSGLAIKLQSQYYTGLPDRMILMPGGYIGFVEVKTTGKKPTRRQEAVYRKLADMGFVVEVIDDEGGLRDFLDFLKLMAC